MSRLIAPTVLIPVAPIAACDVHGNAPHLSGWCVACENERPVLSVVPHRASEVPL